LLLEAAQAVCTGALTMFHDLIIAVVFLAMIVAPALITLHPDRDEKDPL
jgi:hypothetical protein